VLILGKEKIPSEEGSFPNLNPKKKFENKCFSGSSELGFRDIFMFLSISTY
jgi:hypothetical protein